METAIAKAVLEGAGLPTDKFDELDKLTADQVTDFKADTYLEPITSAQSTKLLNDPKFYEGITEDKLPTEFKKKIESAQYGRFINEFKDVATKELGLKEGEDFTTDDATKLKVFAKKVATQYAGKHASPDAVKKVQQDLVTALKEKEDLETGFDAKLNEAVGNEKTSAASKMERLVGMQSIAAIKDLNVKPHIVADHLLNTLKSKFTVKLDPDTLEFSLKQKSNPELDVLNGSNVVTFNEALTALAKDEGLLKEADEDKKDKKEGTVILEVDNEKAGVIPDYIKDKMGTGKKD